MTASGRKETSVDKIEIGWDSEHLIIAAFNAPWTWDDFHSTVAEIHRMIASVEHTVDVIIWHKRHMPPANPVSHFSRTLKNQPPNTGRIVIIHPPVQSPLGTFLKSLAAAVQRAYPNAMPILNADTVEEAHALLIRLHDDVHQH